MTKKEKERLEWEFEELLKTIVSSYLKFDTFDYFETSIDTHQSVKEIYDIKITRRGW